MKTKIQLIYLILLFASQSFATGFSTEVDVSSPGFLTGRICSKSTSEVLENVTVDLYSANSPDLVAGTLTNKIGEFSFNMLQPGEYYLVISAKGFRKAKSLQVQVTRTSKKVNFGEILLVPDNYYSRLRSGSLKR